MELNVTFLIQLSAFLLTVLILSTVAWGPILRTLDERTRRIDGARAEAERLTHSSEAGAGTIDKRLGEARAAGQEEMARLKLEGEKAENDLVERAKQDSARAVGTARKELGDATEKARKELSLQAQALAEAIATRTLGRPA